MKKLKLLFKFSHLLLIIVLLLGDNLYSQKYKILQDPVTGDKVYSSKIISCSRGSMGGEIYHYCYLLKKGNDYSLRLKINKGMSNPFTISNIKPMVILMTNDTINLFPADTSNSESSISGFGGLTLFFQDRESQQFYDITMDEIMRLKNGFFVKAKIYYDSEQRLNGTAYDREGNYFDMRTQNRFKNSLNKKLDKRITELLELE